MKKSLAAMYMLKKMMSKGGCMYEGGNVEKDPDVLELDRDEAPDREDMEDTMIGEPDDLPMADEEDKKDEYAPSLEGAIAKEFTRQYFTRRAMGKR